MNAAPRFVPAAGRACGQQDGGDPPGAEPSHTRFDARPGWLAPLKRLRVSRAPVVCDWRAATAEGVARAHRKLEREVDPWPCSVGDPDGRGLLCHAAGAAAHRCAVDVDAVGLAGRAALPASEKPDV